MSSGNKLIIAPSLLASDFGRLADAARDSEKAGAEYLHFDVMDGRFVPNISMGPAAVKALRPVSAAFFDVHLMIVEPEHYIDDFVKAGADGITVQLEACLHLQRILSHIKASGKKVGVAVNPSTLPEQLEYVMDLVDLILVMTVNPGFGGQAFIPTMLPKIRKVREMITLSGRDIHLQVDGGIASDTTPLVVQSGANVLVAGTSVFGHPGGAEAGVKALIEAALQ